MAALDIFNGDAFSVQSLTKTLNDTVCSLPEEAKFSAE